MSLQLKKKQKTKWHDDLRSAVIIKIRPKKKLQLLPTNSWSVKIVHYFYFIYFSCSFGLDRKLGTHIGLINFFSKKSSFPGHTKPKRVEK